MTSAVPRRAADRQGPRRRRSVARSHRRRRVPRHDEAVPVGGALWSETATCPSGPVGQSGEGRLVL